MSSVSRWLTDPTLRRWAAGWGVFVAFGLLVGWGAYIVQFGPSVIDAAIMLFLMLLPVPIAWFVCMWVTAEIVALFRGRRG